MRRFVYVTATSFLLVAACSPGTSDNGASSGGSGGGSSSSSGGSSGGSSGSSSGDPLPDGAPPFVSKVDVTTEVFEGQDVVVAVPKTYSAARAYPLVFVFHGDGQNGPAMRSGYTFDDVSGDEAIVVYPSGPNADWDLYTPYAQNVGVIFFESLLASLRARFHVGNVFGVGWSKGAFFVNQTACRNPALFRAIVSHAGGAPYEQNDPTATTWPNGYVKCNGQSNGVAALLTHGTSDGAVPFASGDFNRQYWGYVNGCQDSLAPTTPSPCEEYAGCQADKPVVWCAIPGGDHGVWSQGRQAAWSFFERF